MIIKRRVILSGKSRIITLPANWEPEVKKGDEIVVDLKLKHVVSKYVTYRCKKCEHRFDEEKSYEPYEPYCVACGCEDLEELKK